MAETSMQRDKLSLLITFLCLKLI